MVWGVCSLSVFFNTRPSTLRDERFFVQTRVSSLSRIRFRVAFRAFTSPRACACAWTFCTDVSFFPARRSEKKNLGCIKKGKKYTRRERNKKKSNEVFGLHLIKNTRRVLSLCAHAPHETTPRCRHAQQQKHEEETR